MRCCSFLKAMVAFACIVFCLLALDRNHVFGQTKDSFEGVLHITFELSDSSGHRTSFPWQEMIEYHTKNHILQKLTKQTRTGDFDMYLDADAHILYKVDHDQNVLMRLGKKSPMKIEPLEFKKLGETDLLGYACDIYFVRFVNDLASLNEFLPVNPLTVSRTYFIARDLKVMNSAILAGLQENRNTMLFDGRFNAVALKIIEVFPNGDTLIVNTTKVEERDVQEEIKLPSYPVRE